VAIPISSHAIIPHSRLASQIKTLHGPLSIQKGEKMGKRYKQIIIIGIAIGLLLLLWKPIEWIDRKIARDMKIAIEMIKESLER
jgi:hypothetical protein